MMHTAVFILYFILLCLAVTRIRFFTNSIRPRYLVLLFAMHVAAGCMHTWIAFHYYPNHGDIWSFFAESIAMKQQLLAHPVQFFKSIFSNGGGFNLRDTSQPLLDVQYRILQYLNVFLDLLSFNNFYTSTLLFSFPVFAGSMALFKTFYAVYKKPIPALCAVLLPSLLFWTSVIYKDSLFIMAIGYFFYYYFLQPNISTFFKGALLLLCTALLMASRANALVSLVPAMLFFLLTEKKSMGKKLAACITIAAVFAGAIAFNAVLPGGVLARVCDRQKDFQLLTGGSRLYLPALTPTATGFLSVFPAAFLNGFFQPFPGAGGKSVYTVFSAELLCGWAIILFACLLAARKKIRFGNFDLSCLLFALPGLLTIGYMIPFAGAIVRYRSIYLPFLLVPFINIICSYPFTRVQSVNDWIDNNIMATEAKAGR